MVHEQNRWPFLDFIRFSAALLVMFGHVRSLFFESIYKVEGAGVATKAFYVVSGVHHEAVILFFVVSGFLIGGRAWELIEQGRFDLGRYFLDRFSRIYLVLIPALVLIATIQALGLHSLADTRLFGVGPVEPIGVTGGWTWGQVPCHLASIQSVACASWGIDPPLWSLGFEWTFYFLAPLLFAISYAAFNAIARASALLILLCAIIAIVPPAGEFLWLLAIWFLGALSARTVKRTSLPVSLGVAGLALIVGAMVLSRTKSVPIMATDAAIALGLAVALASRPIAAWRFAKPIVQRGASCSFSLYVLHVPIGLLIGASLEKLGWPRELVGPGFASYSAFVITALGALAAAYVFARATEHHTAAFRNWLKRPLPSRSVTRLAAQQ
jgi:peptidoglycan/LPS O-acetylase OafA/YrhL